MIETEPEWDQDSRDLAYAMYDLEQDTCPGCGKRLSETLHVDGEPDAQWDVGLLTCTACRATGIAQQKQAKDDEKAAQVVPGARRWVAIPRRRKAS